MYKTIIIHFPFWKGRYFRYELDISKGWASGGRNPDGSLKIYHRNFNIQQSFGITKGKVNYSWFEREV